MGGGENLEQAVMEFGVFFRTEVGWKDVPRSSMDYKARCNRWCELFILHFDVVI